MSNFQRVWLVSGMIFGLGMSALDAFLYDRNLLIIFLVGIVSGSISGFCFGIIARYLSRSEKTSCLTGFLLTLAGFLLGIGSFIGLDKLPHGQWEQIISPPEKAVQFVGQSAFTFWGGSVYVETENGNIYSYTCDSENPCNWAQEETPPSNPEENFWSCSPDYKGSYATPLILFKKVVDAYQVDICGVDYTNQINLVLLDDGTIWVWNRFSSGIEIIFYVPIWLIISSAAGFAGYITLFRKKKQPLQNEIIA